MTEVAGVFATLSITCRVTGHVDPVTALIKHYLTEQSIQGPSSPETKEHYPRLLQELLRSIIRYRLRAFAWNHVNKTYEIYAAFPMNN